jgi:hypothetical protein
MPVRSGPPPASKVFATPEIAGANGFPAAPMPPHLFSASVSAPVKAGETPPSWPRMPPSSACVFAHGVVCWVCDCAPDCDCEPDCMALCSWLVSAEVFVVSFEVEPPMSELLFQ